MAQTLRVMLIKPFLLRAIAPEDRSLAGTYMLLQLKYLVKKLYRLR